MTKEAIKIAITGAAGNIGYSALFRIAAGDVFGKDQPVSLSLIEIEPAMKALEGTVMELNDCAFPLLQNVDTSSDLNKGFSGVNWALLIGSVPRKKGMERSDLLGINGKIFTSQGQAIEKNVASDIRTLVVGNPCNTNCLIAMNNAKDIPAERWFAMTRLDENRAKSQISEKAGVHSSEVSRLAIWGNHSATQYPDFTNGLINGKKITDVISDKEWLENDFLKTVQQRGAQIIQARGASSAASAASAALDTVRSLTNPTPDGDITSVAICSKGQYGIEEGLIASMPLVVKSNGSWEVDESFEVNDFSREKIDATISELKEEKEAVKNLL